LIVFLQLGLERHPLSWPPFSIPRVLFYYGSGEHFEVVINAVSDVSSENSVVLLGPLDLRYLVVVFELAALLDVLLALRFRAFQIAVDGFELFRYDTVSSSIVRRLDNNNPDAHLPGHNASAINTQNTRFPPHHT